MPLSGAVLRRVVRHADQATRVACALSCRHANLALRHAGVWDSVTVYKPGVKALVFLRATQCRSMRVPATDGYRLTWFLESCLSFGLHETLRSVYVALRGAIPTGCSLLEPLSAFPYLRDLVVECEEVPLMGCLVFPQNFSGLRDLRTLRIVDCTLPHRNVEVYFHGATFPSLQKVCVKAVTSDVLSSISSSYLVREVVYMSDRETFEDACLDGVCLDRLHLTIGTSSDDLGFLMTQLARARRIHRLLLECGSDVKLDAHMNCGHVALFLTDGARRAEVTYAALRGMASLAVDAVSDDGSWQLALTGTGSWHNFRMWLKHSDLHVGLGGKVVVDPDDDDEPS